MIRVLAAVALAGAVSGAAPPEAVPGPGGGRVVLGGVPITGIAGTIRSQKVDGATLALGLDGGEVRISPWPGGEGAPRLVGQWLAAKVSPDPGGPSRRLELGPVGGPPRWVVGTSLREGAPVVGHDRLGRARARDGGGAEVPVLEDGAVVARLAPGGAAVLRDGKTRWCIRVLSIGMPPSRPTRGPEQADGQEEPRVDLLAIRMRSAKEPCRGAVSAR